MQIFGPSHVHGGQPLQGPHYARSGQNQPQARASTPVSGDQLDISPAAEAAAVASEAGSVREGRIARIRQEIEAGTYETHDKLDQALDRLLDQIG